MYQRQDLFAHSIDLKRCNVIRAMSNCAAILGQGLWVQMLPCLMIPFNIWAGYMIVSQQWKLFGPLRWGALVILIIGILWQSTLAISVVLQNCLHYQDLFIAFWYTLSFLIYTQVLEVEVLQMFLFMLEWMKPLYLRILQTVGFICYVIPALYAFIIGIVPNGLSSLLPFYVVFYEMFHYGLILYCFRRLKQSHRAGNQSYLQRLERLILFMCLMDLVVISFYALVNESNSTFISIAWGGVHNLLTIYFYKELLLLPIFTPKVVAKLPLSILDTNQATVKRDVDSIPMTETSDVVR